MAIAVRGLAPLLQVYDMPTSVRFYRDQLFFEIIGHSGDLAGDAFHWVWLRLGDVEVMLNSAYETDEERPVPMDAARRASHGDTCLFLGCPDVDAAYRVLVERGVEVEAPRLAPYGMKQMYLRDPDGYGLCFQWKAAGR